MRYSSSQLISIMFLAVFLITGCSSGGGGSSITSSGVSYTGNTSPAAIDASNVEAVGKTAGESVQQADNSANTTTGLPGAIDISSASIDLNQLNDIIISTAKLSILATGVIVDVSADVCTSGNASADVIGSGVSGPLDLDITYSNCQVVSTSVTASGKAVVHFNDINNFDAGFSIRYTNFRITDVNGTTTINMTVECSDSTSCTYNSDFVGSDGATHRITGFSNITGDAINGYNGSATLFHNTQGRVNITYSNITFGNCGNFPDGGTISINSNDGSSGTIIFAFNCSVSGTWDDGITGGIF